MRLLRIASLDLVTFGVLLEDGVPFATTLELPWRANEPERSCIPAGSYVCQRVQSPKFGETFEVTHVPNRSHILLHKGNVAGDTLGCILIGEAFHTLGIAYSSEGFREFMDRTKGQETVPLEIVDGH